MIMSDDIKNYSDNKKNYCNKHKQKHNHNNNNNRENNSNYSNTTNNIDNIQYKYINDKIFHDCQAKDNNDDKYSQKYAKQTGEKVTMK